MTNPTPEALALAERWLAKIIPGMVAGPRSLLAQKIALEITRLTQPRAQNGGDLVALFESGFQGHPRHSAGAFGEDGTEPDMGVCLFEFTPDQVATLRTSLTGGWRPICEAPKDETRILLGKFVGHPDHATSCWWVIAGRWSLKWKNWSDGVEPCGLAGPTHWMEIPKPWPFPTPPADGEKV